MTFSLLNLPDRGCLVVNTHGEWSSQLKHMLIGKYVRVITRSHTGIITIRVKDCGYIKMSELREENVKVNPGFGRSPEKLQVQPEESHPTVDVLWF